MKLIPESFKNKISEILDEENYQKFIDSYQETPSRGIRTNRLKISSQDLREKLPEEFKARDIPWCEDGFYIDAQSRPGKRPEYYSGLYYPQEPSAMIPGETLKVNEGDMVLDLCAAPGGKSTQLAGKLGPNGTLVLNEIVKGRVGILSSNVERMGITNAIILNENPAHLVKNFKEKFDKILVDAPCSGEGMFRKDPDVIAEWQEDRPGNCALRQEKILETVDGLLKPGGELVYSTCTFAPEENEELIENFLRKYDYELLDTNLQGIKETNLNNIKVSPEVLNKTVRVWPHLNEGEGHYVARLKKQGFSTSVRRNRKRNNNLKKGNKKNLKDFYIFRDQYLEDFDSDRLYIYENELIQLPPNIVPEDLTGLKVVSAGLKIGEFKKNRFEPAHALAMSLKKEQFNNTYEMSENELWDYLKGLEIKPGQTVKNGWVLMCYEGYPVGFGKYSGTIKNKYPKGLRIYKK